MALIKIYTEQKNINELREHVAHSIKLVGAATLNVHEVPTTPAQIETVLGEGLDLIGIDYICEIIAVERPNEQTIAEVLISGLNKIYPDKLFSVYFVHISKEGMSNTPRAKTLAQPITLDKAILLAKRQHG